jgi:hypothetical protein
MPSVPPWRIKKGTDGIIESCSYFAIISKGVNFSPSWFARRSLRPIPVRFLEIGNDGKLLLGGLCNML